MLYVHCDGNNHPASFKGCKIHELTLETNEVALNLIRHQQRWDERSPYYSSNRTKQDYHSQGTTLTVQPRWDGFNIFPNYSDNNSETHLICCQNCSGYLTATLSRYYCIVGKLGKPQKNLQNKALHKIIRRSGQIK